MKNPLIQRYQCSLLRPKQKWVFASIYLIFLGLILLLSYVFHVDPGASERIGSFQLQSFYKTIFVYVFIVQLFLMCGWSPYNTSLAIRDEVLQRTHDFFRMLPLTACQKTIGILLGRNCLVLLLSEINLIFVLVFAFASGISVRLQLEVLILLTATSVFFNLTALLSSTFFTKEKRTTSIGAIIFLLLCLSPLLTIGISLLDYQDSMLVHWNYYGVKMPLQIFIAFIETYFSVWVFVGILRRFNHEDKPLFDFYSAILFMLGFLFMLWGSLWQFVMSSDWQVETFLVLMVLGFLPLLFIPFASMKSSFDYLEYCSLKRTSEQGKPTTLWTLLKFSNLCLWIVLYFIWSGFVISAALVLNVPFLFIFRFLALFFTFYAFFIFLIEMNVVYKSVINKIKNLLITIYICHFLVPPILSGIFLNSELYLFNVIGFLTTTLGSLDRLNPSIDSELMLWSGNGILCVISGSFIVRRYLCILAEEKVEA